MPVFRIHLYVEKMIEKNKESQSNSLAELQQELKSLKGLLLSRGPSFPSSTSPSPGLPGFTGRPSIPAWQLAGGSSTAEGRSSDLPLATTSSFNGLHSPLPKASGGDPPSLTRAMGSGSIANVDGESSTQPESL